MASHLSNEMRLRKCCVLQYYRKVFLLVLYVTTYYFYYCRFEIIVFQRSSAAQFFGGRRNPKDFRGVGKPLDSAGSRVTEDLLGVGRKLFVDLDEVVPKRADAG